LNRILVVGGTGMLRGCVERLSQNPETEVAVLARRAFCCSSDQDSIRSILCDYSDSAALHEALDTHTREHGIFDAAILWVHSIAPDAPGIIVRSVKGDVLHVLGSSGKTNNAGRTVTLGSIRETDADRWLTHSEICDGVYQAFVSGRQSSIVGEID